MTYRTTGTDLTTIIQNAVAVMTREDALRIEQVCEAALQIQAGVTERGWHRCAVDAGSAVQACIIAAQLVAATTGVPTRTRLVKEIP